MLEVGVPAAAGQMSKEGGEEIRNKVTPLIDVVLVMWWQHGKPRVTRETSSPPRRSTVT